ncbi:MAG: helix-turn-helix transcriptional regulator [Syntrophobacteraceae bacterium]
MEISQRQIALLRRSQSLSQAAFAKEVGYSQSYVGDIESGRVMPSRRFLEAVGERFKVSIDQLTSDLGEQILRVLESISSISGGGFLYMYDFTDKGLDVCEAEALNIAQPHPHRFLDAVHIKTTRQMLHELTGMPLGSDMWDQFCIHYGECLFYIIKNISKSPMTNKDKIYFLKDVSELLGGTSNLIVIDKPSFLEKNANKLYYFAYPFRVSGRFGRINY